MADILENKTNGVIHVRGVPVAPGEAVEVEEASNAEKLVFGLVKPEEAVKPVVRKVDPKAKADADAKAAAEKEAADKAAAEAAAKAAAEAAKKQS